jgi:hypothetical protein
MLTVKNVGQGPQVVEGAGILEHGQSGQAEDTQHTRALLDAGHLLELDESTSRRSRTAAAGGEE